MMAKADNPKTEPAPNFAVKSKGATERKVYAKNEHEAREKFKALAQILDTENPIEVIAITEG